MNVLLALGLLGPTALPLAAAAQDQVISVWSGAAPGSETWTQKEVDYRNGRQAMVRNVVQPTLTAYLPDRAKAVGTGVVICPGGGFHFLSWDSEGVNVAKWLQQRGVAAFVLKYRLIDTGATEEEFQKRTAQLFGGRMPSRSRRSRNRRSAIFPLWPPRTGGRRCASSGSGRRSGGSRRTGSAFSASRPGAR